MKSVEFNYSVFTMLLGLFFFQVISCQEPSEIIDDSTVTTERTDQKEFQSEIFFALPDHVTEQGEEKINDFLNNMTGEDLEALAINVDNSKVSACCKELLFVTNNVYCNSDNSQYQRCGVTYKCTNGKDYFYQSSGCFNWQYNNYGYCPSRYNFPNETCGDYHCENGLNKGLKSVTKFMQHEIENNLDNLMKLYIENKTEIDEALEQKNMAASFAEFFETNAEFYYLGFAEGQELIVQQKHIDAAKPFLTQLSSNLSTQELKDEISSLIGSLELAQGQELKTAIKSLDNIQR